MQIQTQSANANKRCGYKPDCPWGYGGICSSPNDHSYNECDYDRGIFPDGYNPKSKTQEECGMSDIRFYIPKDETIPTDLRLYVGDVYVRYERIKNGFRFHISVDDEDKAINIAKEISDKMKREHNEFQHGISWRTVSLEVVPQDERYRIDTIVDWIYRVRDSY